VNSVGAAIIEVERNGPVASLWLNRPELRNAFDEQLIAAFTESLQALAADEAVRVVVIGGRGPAFCAGADLAWMQRMAGYGEAENRADAAGLAAMLQALATLPKPTIARVQGVALAGGSGIVAACDIAIATSEASFATTEVRLGLVPATISPYVIAAIGPRAARRLFLTGERIGAAEAQRLGLVHELCAPEALDTIVAATVAALLQGAPGAQRAAKQLVADVAGQPLTRALIEHTSQCIAAARASPEAREGIAAFFARRKPRWVP
jgi:methylglutaconyl-CoA hydratase